VNRISDFTLTLERTVKGIGMHRTEGFQVIQMGKYYVERGGIINIPASSIQLNAGSLTRGEDCIASIWVNHTFGREITGIFARYGPMVKWSEYFKASVVLASQVDKNNEFGCEPYSWSQRKLMEGKFLVVPRGKCLFSTKTRHAEQSGSVGVIVVNHHEDVLTMIPETPDDVGSIRIPSIMISSSEIKVMADLAIEGTPVSLSGRNCRNPDSRLMMEISKKPVFNIRILENKKRRKNIGLQFDCRMNSLLDKGQSLACIMQCPTDSQVCCAH
jgi:hypothetical protein